MLWIQIQLGNACSHAFPQTPFPTETSPLNHTLRLKYLGRPKQLSFFVVVCFSLILDPCNTQKSICLKIMAHRAPLFLKGKRLSFLPKLKSKRTSSVFPSFSATSYVDPGRSRSHTRTQPGKQGRKSLCTPGTCGHASFRPISNPTYGHCDGQTLRELIIGRGELQLLPLDGPASLSF